MISLLNSGPKARGAQEGFQRGFCVAYLPLKHSWTAVNLRNVDFGYPGDEFGLSSRHGLGLLAAERKSGIVVEPDLGGRRRELHQGWHKSLTVSTFQSSDGIWKPHGPSRSMWEQMEMLQVLLSLQVEPAPCLMGSVGNPERMPSMLLAWQGLTRTSPSAPASWAHLPRGGFQHHFRKPGT